MEGQSLRARLEAVKRQAEIDSLKEFRSNDDRQSLITFNDHDTANVTDHRAAVYPKVIDKKSLPKIVNGRPMVKRELPSPENSNGNVASGGIDHGISHHFQAHLKTTNKRKVVEVVTGSLGSSLQDTNSSRKHRTTENPIKNTNEEGAIVAQSATANRLRGTTMDHVNSLTELTTKQEPSSLTTDINDLNTPKAKDEYENNVIDTQTTRFTSEWYEGAKSGKRVKLNRSDLEALKYVNTLIRDLKTNMALGEPIGDQIAKIRLRIHQMRFYDFLSKDLLVRSRILEPEGLAQIFENGNIFPWDICDDARELHQRWIAGKLDPSLLIGIKTLNKRTKGGKDAISRSFDNDYKARVPCDYQGEGELMNGSWWPLQFCAMRDGAHGEIEAGIHGHPRVGAFSIVLSNGGGYDDVDEGEVVKYCGTPGTKGAESAGTRCLLRTCSQRSPIRLLRSHALPLTNKYRPRKGIRYDGIYLAEGFELLNPDLAMYRFTLVRVGGQQPIRYQGVEKRPTNEELSEYQKIRHLSGLAP